MSVEIKVPALGESVTEATVARWLKKPGEAVAVDEPLVELETDKVTLEVNATAAGVLEAVVAEEGANVEVGALLGHIGEGSGAPAAKQATKADAPAAKPAAAPAPAAKANGNGADAPIAMPSAAKIIAENNLDAGAIAGSGKGGRILKEDAQAAASGGAKPAGAPASATVLEVPAFTRPESGPRPQKDREERVRMTKLRKTIATRLKQAQNNAAMLTTFNEVDMGALMALRNQYKDSFEKKHGVKLGFMSFFVKAAVHALKKYPVLNASVDGTDIVYHGYFDIGIAVGSPRGLVVPILRNADQMSFADIEKKIAEFGKKAAEGKLGIEEMTGGTFSISNGGTFGSMMSTPIINPPQSAILGVHATKDRAVVENGQIVIRPMNYLAMSYDHRIIDGREAVLGLVAMKEALEDPARLLFDI